MREKKSEQEREIEIGTECVKKIKVRGKITDNFCLEIISLQWGFLFNSNLFYFVYG